jgi:hypothetical protein
LRYIINYYSDNHYLSLSLSFPFFALPIKNEFPGSLKPEINYGHPIYRYRSARKANALKFISYFNLFPLLSYKAKNYSLWKDAADIIKSREREHLQPAGIDKILAIKEAMSYELIFHE